MSVEKQQPRRVLVVVDAADTFTALCRDDACPWKHRGVSVEGTHIKAEEHALGSGHEVTVYEEHRTSLGATEIA